MRVFRTVVELWLPVLLAVVSLPAQQRNLETLATDFELRWRQERANAESIARRLGMPIRSIGPDGTTTELSRFRAGRPLYYITDNANAARTISTDKVYPGGIAGYLLTGVGVTLGEWDGGGVLSTHQEFATRILTTEGAPHFHSTHVAGTMIASGFSAASRGMAFAAELKAYDWTNDLSEMAAQAALGLRASNHSYGFITGWTSNYFGDGKWAWFGDPGVSQTEDYRFGFYDDEARDWDQIAYNAPYYLMVKSAGNDRNEGPSGSVMHWVFNGGWDTVMVARSRDGNAGYDCLNGSGVSKNALVVGAVNDLVGGYSTPGTVSMSSFSAWGPTDDGRIKPDVVANGVALTSALETSNSAYGSLSGTSMATPSVTGSVGLLLEHHRNLHGNDSILASRVKGIILHTADEAGTDPGPDYRFGWGLMNTLKAANVMALDVAEGAGSHIREVDIALGGATLIDVGSTGTEPLRATICWTDAAGISPPTSLDPPDQMLRNDVDLRIVRKSDGAIFTPWTLNPASPAAAASTGDNSRDNVEQVVINSPGVDQYAVRLTFKPTLSAIPVRVSLIVTGNTPMPGPSATTYVDTVKYVGLPGDIFTDSITIYNSRATSLAGPVTVDTSCFWIDLAEDSLAIAPLDSQKIHFTVDGSLWNQWTTYASNFTFPATDTSVTPLVIPVVATVLGPTIGNSPGSFVFHLDSAETGTDTLVVRNTGPGLLVVVVEDSSGSFPPWLVVDADTISISSGDSVKVALDVNAVNAPPGNYATEIVLTNNDSATGLISVPVVARIATGVFYPVELGDRWNLASLPVLPVNPLKSALFPTALTPAFGFNDGYFQADSLQPGPAYWMKFLGAQTEMIDGNWFLSDTIPLAAGWNLAGSLFQPFPVSSIVTAPPGILSSDFYGYENGYQVADSILPGKGYWVQSSQAGQLYYTLPAAAAPKTAARNSSGEYNSVTITDGASGSGTLYFASGGTVPAKTALPPKPPAGAFDARFGDETAFASFPADPAGEESRTIVIVSDGKELTLTARIRKSDGTRYFVADASGERRALADGATLTIAPSREGPTTIRLVAGGGNIPAEFRLGQNFPNPFNPSTRVAFSVPVEGMVTIRLYNILGNEVATLASRRYEAGRHEVEFNAASLPSGVYVYTMRAGTFSQSRKMVLMR